MRKFRIRMVYTHAHIYGPCPAKSNPQKLKDYPGLRAATASRNGRVTTTVLLDHPTRFNLDAEKPICILYFLRAGDVRSITGGAKKGV